MARFSIILGICIFLALKWGFSKADQFCYEDVKKGCADNQYSPVCRTEYGVLGENLSDLQKLANSHLARSNQFLMMAKHFSNYQFARPSSHHGFMRASNYYFVDAIHLIRYITDRGGIMDFSNVLPIEPIYNRYDIYELPALAWCLDVEKKLAQQTADLHQHAGSNNPSRHDGDLAYYLETQFASKHRMRIKLMVQIYVLMEKMLTCTDQTLALYDFDDFMTSVLTF